MIMIPTMAADTKIDVTLLLDQGRDLFRQRQRGDIFMALLILDGYYILLKGPLSSYRYLFLDSSPATQNLKISAQIERDHSCN